MIVTYAALCVVAIAGYRVYERLAIVESETAYVAERISSLEDQVAELSARVDDLEGGTAEDEEDDPSDPARFGQVAGPDGRHQTTVASLSFGETFIYH